MKKILVFNTGNLVGVAKIPEPDKNELVSLYEKWTIENNETANLLYFVDMNYAIVIPESTVQYFREIDEMI
jgi:hypothetical protein